MLESLKKIWLIRWLYKFPVLFRIYHFKLAFWGNFFSGFPSRKIFLIGVTGTKGKSTVIEFLNSILEEAGKKTALLSSVYIKIGDKKEKNLTGNSMPGRFFIPRFLKRAVTAKCHYAIVEVTSQGVELYRHKFLQWRIGVITNLAPEHIEHHGSFERYRGMKLKFLNYAAREGAKIFVNADDESSNFFVENVKRASVILYSKTDRDLNSALPRTAGDYIDKNSNSLSEEFNRENIAVAVAVAKQVGISNDIIKTAIKNFKGLPGRMDVVQDEPFKVIVDYAHTPDSLKKVYELLANRKSSLDTTRDKQIANHGGEQGPAKKLICVLGSAGGGRDKWKRPVMGEIAGQFCDEVILTNEDPYDENPNQILTEIALGFSQIVPRHNSGQANRKSQIYKILDRREAIGKAIDLAKEGDTVIITGKGSEDYIHLEKGKKIVWSDRGVVEEILKE